MKTSIRSLALMLLIAMITFQCSDSDSDKCNPIETSAGDDIEVASTSVPLNASPLETNQNGRWEVISGNNGIFEDSSFNNTLFTGTPGEAYVLRWTVSNGCSEAFDEVQITLHSPGKLKSLTYKDESGNLVDKREYFYDTQGRIEVVDYTYNNGAIDHRIYVYGINGKIEKESIDLVEILYFYQPDGKLEKTEIYEWNTSKTFKTIKGIYNYTYQGNQSIQMISSLGPNVNITYEFDSNGDWTKKIYNHLGGTFWSQTYYSDRLFKDPLSEIDPVYSSKHLVKTYSHSTLPAQNYTSSYTFDVTGNPKEETLTFSNKKIFGVYVFE